MKVYFLRHGIAVDAAEWKGGDADRPLTDDGRKQLKKIAKALRDLDLGLNAIVTSPLLRAKHTAEIVAGKLGIDVQEDERLSPEFDNPRLSELLQDHRDAQSILLVGHEPSMSTVIGKLVLAAKIDLKKAGIALVDVPAPSSQSGTLLWLIPPKVLLG
ncbi:MAG TPA: phosphohistidine phosphatase SixA [Candidatus Rubrimentiphilum sp.]|nr:phosphohistidine phosphatase SixA [Candidatus Rubrimentiphilum sp.]